MGGARGEDGGTGREDGGAIAHSVVAPHSVLRDAVEFPQGEGRGGGVTVARRGRTPQGGKHRRAPSLSVPTARVGGGEGTNGRLGAVSGAGHG